MALAETLPISATLRELGLDRNDVGSGGAAAIASALRCNETLERLDLSGNSISDEGAMALLEVLMESNCSLTWLDLEENAEISPSLQNQIEFVLTSRRVLKLFCKCLCKPLDKKMTPMAIQAVQQNSFCRANPEVVRSQETTAGPIFLLVRAALNDSKFITEPRKRSRTP
jgi:Leucine Rich repeat